MALGFGSKSEDVLSLIAKKNYARAIEVLRVQIESDRRDPRLRLQLADVLVLARKEREAIGILVPLADEYARDGFAAKAIAVLKKIQKIDPGRREVGERLASLIQEKQRVATAVAPSSGLEIGMDEIGLEFPMGGSVAVAAAPSRPPTAEPSAPPAASVAPYAAVAPEPVLSMAPAPSLEVTPEPEEPALVLVPPAEISLDAPSPVPVAPVPPPSLAAPVPSAVPIVAAGPVLPPAAPRPVSVIEDPDLLYMEEDGEGAEVEVEPEVEAEPVATGDPMSDSRFGEELQALVDSAFLSPAAEVADASPAPEKSGSQIVVSPLFRDFSVDEMVAVIQGLNLLTFARGDVILREGQRGDSLYMLTSGMVRAFRKDAKSGKQVKVADLTEGAFFGEVSILTGGPRTATVAALTACELLELDRPTLDSIRQAHPHVWDVLEEFGRRRVARRP